MKVIGLNPIRIVLIGGEYAIGFGSSTRAQALDGAIAHAVHQATGRGVIVENRSQDQLRLRDLPISLGLTGAHTFDLVLWAPTFAEAARYLTLRPWRDGISALLTTVHDSSSAGVVLLGIPALTGAQPIAVIARWRAAQINHVLSNAVKSDQRAFMVEPPDIAMRNMHHVAGAEVYRDVAARVLPAALQALDSRHTPAPRTADRGPRDPYTTRLSAAIPHRAETAQADTRPGAL